MEFKKEDINLILEILDDQTPNSQEELLKIFNNHLNKQAKENHKYVYFHALQNINRNITYSFCDDEYREMKSLFEILKNDNDIINALVLAKFIENFEKPNWKEKIDETLKEDKSIEDFLLRRAVYTLTEVADVVHESLKEMGLRSIYKYVASDIRPYMNEKYDSDKTYMQFVFRKREAFASLIGDETSLKKYVIKNHFSKFSKDDWYKTFNIKGKFANEIYFQANFEGLKEHHEKIKNEEILEVKQQAKLKM